MCGRFSIHLADLSAIGEALGVMRSGIEVWEPRFNVAPTQRAPVVRQLDVRAMDSLRWGLVPHWAKDMSVGSRLINARIETVASKPAFRESFAKRRCVVPVTGYYEWQRADGRRTPMWIHPTAGDVAWLAGLWSRWRDPVGEPIDTFTLLTRPATGMVAEIHDRMPVALAVPEASHWLTQSADEAFLRRVLRCSEDTSLWGARQVSPHVNSPRHDDAQCIAPHETHAREQLTLF